MRVTRLAVVVVSAGVLAATGCTTRSAHTGGASASPTARPAGGVDLAAAVRQWYRRVGTMSASHYFDPQWCGMNQPDTIWLLGGGAPGGRTPPMSPERSCAVAANRPILAPVVNDVATAAPSPIPAPSPGGMNVTLDGRPLTPVRVTNGRPYAIVSAVPGNPLDLRAGTRLVDDGYWVLVDPGLAPGRHRLEIRAPGGSNRLWTLVAS